MTDRTLENLERMGLSREQVREGLRALVELTPEAQAQFAAFDIDINPFGRAVEDFRLAVHGLYPDRGTG